MKKKLSKLFFILFMALCLIPWMKTTIYASSDAWVSVDQDYILANIGDEVTLDCTLEDDDGGTYTYAWYHVDDYGNETKVGTGMSYTIKSATKDDFYDTGYNEYRVYLYDDGEELAWNCIDLYTIEGISCTDETRTYEVQLGGKANVKPDLYYEDCSLPASYEELGITFTWTKTSGTSTKTVSNDEALKLTDITASDLGIYHYNVYLDGKKLLTSGDIEFVERESQPLQDVNVLGNRYIISDGEIVGTLPEGVTYDKATNTFTLNGYNGTVKNTFFYFSGGDATIKIIGENTVNFEDSEEYGVTFVDGNTDTLNICGNGTLNLNFSGCLVAFGIKGSQVTTIRDCTLNIRSEDPEAYFYGYTADAWSNYREGAAYAALEIKDATINIDSRMAEDVDYVNAGIDVQDSDLSIENSKIHMQLSGGAAIYGLCTGLEGGSDSYGGDLSIDDQSEVVVEAKGVPRYRLYSMYYYTGNVFETNVYAGESAADSKAITEDDLCGTNRNDCIEYYLEISPHKWTTKVEKPATTSSAGSIVRTCSHCSKTDSSITIPQIATIKLNIVDLKQTWIGFTDAIYAWIEDADGNELDRSEYTVKYPGNITDVGKHTIRVTSNSERYSFDKTFTLTISPAKSTISKVTVGKKSMTVKMKYKVSNSTGGKYYQIAYKQKGTSKWKYTTTSAQSKTIKSLKKGKQYYVKVRAYKKVSGKYYYGAWSSTKTSGKIK